MNRCLYSRLAFQSITKNKKYYIPYMIAGILMVAMFYIMNFLNASSYVRNLKGGSLLTMVFGFGTIVIAVFSLIYLFYTNSFLIRVRNRELGLYSILGMSKRNIVTFIANESLIIFGIVIASGLLAGIGLSKLVEMCLCRLIGENVQSGFTIDSSCLSNSFFFFLATYFLLFLSSAIKIRFSGALDLLHGSNYGERAPKGNILIAIAGIVLLGIAYYMAITIKHPAIALSVFFFAVILVVIATYLIFMSGSVRFCQLLTKDRRYYYQPSHFISVSSMRFRMKRNGAGLASICILMTMVLVMMSMTFTTYAGIRNSVEKAFTSDVISDISLTADPTLDENIISSITDYLNTNITGKKDVLYYPYMKYETGHYTSEGYQNKSQPGFSLETLYTIDLATYNRISHTNHSLQPDECLVLTDDPSVGFKDFCFNDIRWKVKDVIHSQPIGTGTDIQLKTPVTLVINNLSVLTALVDNSFHPVYYLHYTCNLSTNSHINVSVNDITTQVSLLTDQQYASTCSFNEKNEALSSYLQLFGGMLMLCVLLSIMFLVATVLIIYYKQISEGFEDQKRFSILKKVGMTEKEIRRSINSQILIMFFMPLLMAGLHLIFAFPMVYRITIMFGLTNIQLSVTVTLITFLVFALFYAIVYKMTSNTYFRIINFQQ